MIKVIISEEMFKRAKEKADAIGCMGRRSFRHGKGNLVGFLGEEMVKETYPKFRHVDKYSHDFEYLGKTIEVKTKQQNIITAPKGDWEASIVSYSLDENYQSPDRYIFCRVYRDKDGNFPFGWILGSISCEKYKEKSRLLKKGNLDGDNGYIVKNDCYNIFYEELDNWSAED